MNPFLDFSLDKVDWAAFAQKQREAAQIVAAGTPTPLDDLAVNQLADTLIELLVPKQHQTASLFAAPQPAELSPIAVMILGQVLNMALPKLLELLAKLRKPAA